jgi:hypothetical protein
MAFCLLTFMAHTQTVETVATGLSAPLGLVRSGTNLYISEYNSAEISKTDLAQPLPAPVTAVLQGLTKPTGLLVIGDYLYFCMEGALPGGTTSVGRINLTSMNPVIEAVTTNVDPTYGAQVLLRNGDDLYISAANGNAGHQGIHKINLAASLPWTAVQVLSTEVVSGMNMKGNELYFSYYGGSTVKKINISQTNPVPVTVISGLAGPDGLTFNGNFLYISEFDAGKISRIDVTQDNPVAETVASGLLGPSLTAFDGTAFYFAEYIAGKVSRIVLNQPVLSPISTCDNTTATLGGASPGSGIYSGPGITDDGNGETFTFNPAQAGGPGVYAITYTLPNGVSTSSTITVNAAPVIGVFGFLTVVTVPASPLPDPDAGPAGGVYAGPGVLPGNIFDAALAGVGVHLITYTYTDGNGCSATGTGTIQVLPPSDDACAGATDINNLLGGAPNAPQVSSLQNNTAYSVANDPDITSGCFYQNDPLQHTIWYTFTGDGNTYRIRSVQCNATNYIQTGDTQVAIFSGDCDNLAQVTCNDDEDVNTNILNFSVNIATVAGQTYRMLVDGYGDLQGEFCIEVTNVTPSAITEIEQTNIRISPNPTTGMLRMANVDADLVQVFDVAGRMVLAQSRPGATLDLTSIPAGTYFLKVMEKNEVYSARVVKK